MCSNVWKEAKKCKNIYERRRRWRWKEVSWKGLQVGEKTEGDFSSQSDDLHLNSFEASSSPNIKQVKSRRKRKKHHR
jgi:hypothetical protein